MLREVGHRRPGVKVLDGVEFKNHRPGTSRAADFRDRLLQERMDQRIQGGFREPVWRAVARDVVDGASRHRPDGTRWLISIWSSSFRKTGSESAFLPLRFAGLASVRQIEEEDRGPETAKLAAGRTPDHERFVSTVASPIGAWTRSTCRGPIAGQPRRVLAPSSTCASPIGLQSRLNARTTSAHLLRAIALAGCLSSLEHDADQRFGDAEPARAGCTHHATECCR